MNKIHCYLAGSIQAVTDGGVGWRDKITKDLNEFGFEVLDPCKSEVNSTLAPTIGEQKQKLENLKRGGEWDTWKAMMREIRQQDLICVLQSDFIILSYNPSIIIGGTLNEVVIALQNHIPIYTVCYEPLTKANDWTLSLLMDSVDYNGGKIFPNYKQLTEFLDEKYKTYIEDFKVLKGEK